MSRFSASLAAFQRIVLASSALMAVAVVSCSSGTTDPGDDDDNGGGTTVTLTITTKAMDAGYIPGVIYAYISDNVETRAHMPLILDENNAIAKPFGANEKTVTLQVPKGKYVTLFAAEFGTAGNNVKQAGQALSKVPPTTETEFTAWSGASGRLVSAEPGVASIKMDAEANVTGEFRKMEGFTVQYQGCVELAIGSSSPAYLGFGTTQPVVVPTGVTYTNGIVTSDQDWWFMYGKQGTTYTFTAKNTALGGAGIVKTAFLNWSGNAAGAGCGGVTCNVAVPPIGANAPTLISKNTWLNITAPAQALGCGDCVVASGTCSLRP